MANEVPYEEIKIMVPNCELEEGNEVSFMIRNCMPKSEFNFPIGIVTKWDIAP